MIISTQNQKGGAGKTTIAAHLGRAAALTGRRVLLVDTDRQRSLRDWHAAGDGCGMDLIAADTPAAISSVQHIAASYDVVLIDGAPSANGHAAAAIRVSDVVLIPIQPSPLDLWATNDLVSLLQQRQEVADGRPHAALLMSRAITRSVLERELLSALADFGLPVFNSGTHQRVVFASAMASGVTAFEIDGDGPAAQEMRSIWEEVCSCSA